MDLLLLHGPPASGKLTIAKALLEKIPGRLFDNHTSIDVAKALFDFGAPGFWELVRDVRNLALQSASKAGVGLVIITLCYSHPQDQPNFEAVEALVHNDGGRILPVFLNELPTPHPPPARHRT